MAIESPLHGIDAGLGSSLARVSDVDDNQVRLTRLGQSLFDGVTDCYLMTEPGNNLGQTPRCFVKAVPRIAVVTGSANDQDFGHACELFRDQFSRARRHPNCFPGAFSPRRRWRPARRPANRSNGLLR